MISFKEFLKEAKMPKVGAIYKITDGETGPNKDVRYKRLDNGWEVSKDGGSTWKKATDDHPSPLFNNEDIDAEFEMGFLTKA